jgi:hypothetical protein
MMRKIPMTDERSAKTKIKILRKPDIRSGLNSESRRAIGPPNIAGETRIVTASASDSMSKSYSYVSISESL